MLLSCQSFSHPVPPSRLFPTNPPILEAPLSHVTQSPPFVFSNGLSNVNITFHSSSTFFPLAKDLYPPGKPPPFKRARMQWDPCLQSLDPALEQNPLEPILKVSFSSLPPPCTLQHRKCCRASALSPTLGHPAPKVCPPPGVVLWKGLVGSGTLSDGLFTPTLCNHQN